MPTSTYPNHATFVTGVAPAVHGIVANEIPTAGGPVPAWERGLSAAHHLRRHAGRRAAVRGGVRRPPPGRGHRGRAADSVWPDGEFADGVALDVLGYAKDRETAARVRGGGGR